MSAFTFTVGKYVIAGSPQTNIRPLAAGNDVVASTAQDAVIPAQPIDAVCAWPAQDEIVTFGAGQCP